jgi:6-phospho-beta-glucosidase
MKLTIIGGGGVRTPRLIPSLVRRAARLDLHEVWLMDDDAGKLALIGELCQGLAAEQGASFTVHLTTRADEALRDAQHIITSIRPGRERGRASDERIAFAHGVLGQETTGAAGFAMAMRSAPAILAYAEQIEAMSAPGAFIYNFTNPAGLVAQVLQDAGIERIIGICDSANSAQHAVSRFLDVPLGRVHHDVYGLNHLSWTRSVRIDADADGTEGEEVLPGLLENPQFIVSTHMAMFAPGLRAWQGAFLNEYLHYYYHRDEALRALLAKPETRGEEVERLTRQLLHALEDAPTLHARLDLYRAVMNQRSATYMAHARAQPEGEPSRPAEDDEGYAAVALGCVEAIASGEPLRTGLNVPNQGAIPGMRDDDVVEVTCWVDDRGVHPIPVGAIPESHYLLMRDVKQYERLAAQAILMRARALAYEALTVHPLIGSYPLAQKLVDAFIETHRDLIGEWT